MTGGFLMKIARLGGVVIGDGAGRDPARGRSQPPAGDGLGVTPYGRLVREGGGGEPMFAQQVSRAERLAALGYRAFKVEPMMSPPADVVELARRFRRTLGDGLTLMVDV